MAYYNPTETLTSKDIWSAGDANKKFGEDTSLIVARPGKVCCAFPLFWFTVPEGFYALVTRHGKQEDYIDSSGNKTPVWPSGVHIGPPWLKVSHLVTKQTMIFNTPVRGCKTKDNVTVQIDIAILLRVMGDDPKERPGDDPANVYKFVHEVTARGLQQQLMDAQAEAVRTLARSITHTEVFGLRNVSHDELEGVQEKLFSAAATAGFDTAPGFGAEETKDDQEEKDMIGEHEEIDQLEAGFNVETGASVTDAMRARLNRQFQPQGVEILDVIIQQIKLPDDIQNQMANKTLVISQNAEQRMQQKYDMLTLLQQEQIKTLQQSHAEQKMELMKDGEFEAMKESLELDYSKATGEHEIRNITNQMVIDVNMVTAESNLTVQRVRDQTTLEAEQIKEKAEAEAQLCQVSGQAEVDQIDAKARLTAALNSAKGDKALFQAEGISAPKNRFLNDHATSLKKLQAQTSLAANDKLVVTGTSGGNAANQMMLADVSLNDSKLNKRGAKVHPAERSAVLSEVAVASGKAKIRLHVGDDGRQ